MNEKKVKNHNFWRLYEHEKKLQIFSENRNINAKSFEIATATFLK